MIAERGARIFKADRLPWTTARTASGNTMIARVINQSNSAHIGAGIEVLEKVSISWTVTYDEVLFIHEGEMTIVTGGERWACRPGDIVWLPSGTTLDYDASQGRCAYFYALYPVDWAKRQGIEEP
jgi:ethanolamine utilization protein EutQ